MPSFCIQWSLGQTFLTPSYNSVENQHDEITMTIVDSKITDFVFM